MLYVNQLPKQVQAEIIRDAYRINCEWYGVANGVTETEIGLTVEEIINECVLCSKVKDILGTEEEGLLNAEKYQRYA